MPARRLIEAGIGRRDVVIPVRDQGPEQPETLRYVLRSIEAYLPHKKVYIVGHIPDWITLDPDLVTILPTQQRGDKFQNVGTNLLTAVQWSQLSEHFVWLNDDMYFLKPVSSIPLFARLQTVDEFCSLIQFGHDQEHNAFVWGMYTQRDMLQKLGIDTSTAPLTDTHHPMALNKTNVLATLGWMMREYPGHALGHFKAVVSAMHLHEALPTKDPKIPDDQTTIPDHWKFASTYSVSWNGKAGRQIRAMFPEPSKFELYDG